MNIDQKNKKVVCYFSNQLQGTTVCGIADPVINRKDFYTVPSYPRVNSSKCHTVAHDTVRNDSKNIESREKMLEKLEEWIRRVKTNRTLEDIYIEHLKIQIQTGIFSLPKDLIDR